MSNDYYTHGSYPTTGASGSSAAMRAELDLVSSGFDKLPGLTGNASKAVTVNGSATGLTVTTGTLALAANFALTGSAVTINGTGAVTINTPSVSGLTMATLTGTETLTNKTLVAPALGTPASGNLANCTGYVVSSVSLGAITGLGTGVATALAANVGSAGAPVTFNGALGTPSSGTATNLSGTAASLTAGATNALKSATTTIDVSAATAPVSGQVLTATGGSAATWQTPAVATGVRQTVLYAAVDSSGYNNILSAGAGLNFNVDATPTNAVLTFANGNSDSTATLTADASNQGSLAASNTNFIYADYASASSVTWGSTLVPPQYGYAFDRTQNALLNFEGSNGATTTTDDFGNTWTLTSATISTTQFKFGASSLRIGGTGHKCQSASFTSLGDGSFEVSQWVRLDAVGSIQVFFGLENSGGFGLQVRVSATNKLELYASSNGSSWDIASGSAGTTSLSSLTWYKVRCIFDALAGSYKVFLSNNGAAESTEITVASSSRICSVATAWVIGNGSGATLGAVGYHDAFRFIRGATNTSAETPSASAFTVSSQSVNWFSIPEMKMYEVTAASASAGTNPTMTRCDRLFCGEADTGAATVSAMRNYALRGQALLEQATVAASTAYTLNHRVGTRLVKRTTWFECVTADQGYVPGDRLYIDSSAGSGANQTGGAQISLTRNSMNVAIGTGASGIGTIVNKSTPAFGAATVASSWKFGALVERAF